MKPNNVTFAWITWLIIYKGNVHFDIIHSLKENAFALNELSDDFSGVSHIYFIKKFYNLHIILPKAANAN